MSDEYAIWRPEYNGHAPPNWKEGMKWTDNRNVNDFDSRFVPTWIAARHYFVEPEALTAPNETAGQKIIGALEEAIAMVRAMSPETLEKHGITLAPEKDWATELWADLLEIYLAPKAAANVRRGRMGKPSEKAIALIRERVVLKGEG